MDKDTHITITTQVTGSSVSVDMAFDGPNLSETLDVFNEIAGRLKQPLKKLTPQEKLELYYRNRREADDA